MALRASETGPRDGGAFARVTAAIEPGSLLEATPECLVVTRADGQIVFANRRAQLLTGFSRDELVGSTIELLIATDVLALPPEARIEALCRRSGGEQVPVEVNVGAIDGGEPLLVVTLRDLSELQAGRDAQFEAEAKYRALVEHIPAVVYLDPVDENDSSIYVSPQIRDLVGIEPDEWLTDPYAWRTHVHPDDIERAWEEYQEAYNGKWVSYELAARGAGVSSYQFRAPGEWFAEAYAAFFLKKLKTGHPLYKWLQTQLPADHPLKAKAA